MEAHFSDLQRAVSYAGVGLSSHFPGASVEVTCHVHGVVRAKHHVGQVEQLPSVLITLCRRFPGARVTFHPDNPYGLVCTIECECEAARRDDDHSKRKHRQPSAEAVTCPCLQQHDRSRIVIILKQVNQVDVRMGRHSAPAASRGQANPGEI